MKKKIKQFSLQWLYDVLDGNPDGEVVKLGSNVLEVRIPRLNDAVFSEGGPIRLISEILVDSNGATRLTSVYKNKNGIICYRISTSVK